MDKFSSHSGRRCLVEMSDATYKFPQNNDVPQVGLRRICSLADVPNVDRLPSGVVGDTPLSEQSFRREFVHRA